MKSSSVQYMADTLPVEQKLYRLWTVCSISIRKKGWAIMQFYHFSNVLTLTAPMKSLSAMAISIPKKSFSSILDDRQIIFLLALVHHTVLHCEEMAVLRVHVLLHRPSEDAMVEDEVATVFHSASLVLEHLARCVLGTAAET